MREITLNEAMRRSRTSDTALANRVGVDRVTIWRTREERTEPRGSLMDAIQQWFSETFEGENVKLRWWWQ